MMYKGIAPITLLLEKLGPQVRECPLIELTTSDVYESPLRSDVSFL